jgi:hypothetical protein
MRQQPVALRTHQQQQHVIATSTTRHQHTYDRGGSSKRIADSRRQHCGLVVISSLFGGDLTHQPSTSATLRTLASTNLSNDGNCNNATTLTPIISRASSHAHLIQFGIVISVGARGE